MVIYALDVVTACNTADQGATVAEAVRAGLEKTQSVTLSFRGVSDVPSSFINASIVALVKEIPPQELPNRLMISEVTSQIGAMIKRCIANSQRNGEAA